jgi:DNA-binding IclR family transcriptional regulator
MVQPALAATRALSILDFFAAHPGQVFTLSELADALHINLASALSVLTALTDSGYLVRHPRRKTYEIGPVLVGVGAAALLRHRVVALARDEMVGLAADLETECVVSTTVGGRIVILAVEGRPQLASSDVRPGQRLPVVPPVGQVFLAWSGASEIDAWLRRLGGRANPAWQDHLRSALAVVARRGYSIGLEHDRRTRLGEVTAQLADHPHDPALLAELDAVVASFDHEYELLEPEPDTVYDVAFIAAPVFDSDSRVELAITVNGLHQVTGRDVVNHAERLGSVTRQLTKINDGRRPVTVERQRNVGGSR